MNKEKNKIQNTRGITLIALVITIVVLVILVGVTVSTAINSGLIANSKKAVDDYETKQKEEEAGLDALETKMDFLQSQSSSDIKIAESTVEGSNEDDESGESSNSGNVQTKGETYITGVQVEGKDIESRESFASRLPAGYTLEDDPEWGTVPSLNATAVRTGMIVKKDGKKVGRVVVFGDIDGNGKFMTNEVTYLKKATKGTQTFNKTQIQAMDVNHDGKVNGKDVVLLKAKVATPSTEMPQSVSVASNVELRLQSKVVSEYLTDAFNTKYNLVVDTANNTYTITVGSTVTAGAILTDIGDTTSNVQLYDASAATYTKIEDKASTTPVTNGSKIYLNVVEDGYTEETEEKIEINIVVQ